MACSKHMGIGIIMTNLLALIAVLNTIPHATSKQCELLTTVLIDVALKDVHPPFHTDADLKNIKKGSTTSQ